MGTFNHKPHQSKKVGICTVCHDESVGKIKEFNKEWAHKYCINCHMVRNDGPAYCAGCHKSLSLLK